VDPNTRPVRFGNIIFTVLIPSNVIFNKKIALFFNVSDYGSTQTQSMLTTVEIEKNFAATDWN